MIVLLQVLSVICLHLVDFLQVPQGATMLDITWPDEYYNAYAEPSETVEV